MNEDETMTMKTRFLPALLIPALLYFTAPGTASADILFTVDLDTTPLTTATVAPASPFSLAFQLVQGNPNNTTNTATVSDFVFGGGSAAACPANCMTFGEESGDATSSIDLSTSDFFNALTQTFTPGTTLSFLVDLTTNPSNLNLGFAPDTFAFAILDGSDSPIPTQDPSEANTLVTVTINSTNPTVNSYATNPDIGTNEGNVSITMGPAIIESVPEPGTLTLLGTVLVCAGVLRRWRHLRVPNA
jgi:PEP-CTERM motif